MKVYIRTFERFFSKKCTLYNNTETNNTIKEKKGLKR